MKLDNMLFSALAVLFLALGSPLSSTAQTTSAPEHRSITVNYGLSLTEMIAQGRYDWTNRDITEECFPVKGIGKVERGVELIHLGYNISSGDAVKELTKRGLRPATIEELLAFGAKYPDLQRKFPIVCLSSSARVSGNRFVPFLDGVGARRVLYLLWYDYVWSDSCRFLAVRLPAVPAHAGQ